MVAAEIRTAVAQRVAPRVGTTCEREASLPPDERTQEYSMTHDDVARQKGTALS